MSEAFVKAYCEKAKQYYGLKLEDTDGTMRVTDFYDIESATARTLASTADVPDLETAGNLRPCAGCHTRLVASCSCPKEKYSCQPGQGYHFQCLYCKDLHVFSREEGAEDFDAGHVGKRIRLAQGQEVEISAVGAAALEHILVGVGWDIAISGSSMDVDSSVVVKSTSTGASDLVYFGELRHSSGCVVHLGDNLVGGKLEKNEEAVDSENINIYLKKVPEAYDQLYFILNIYACKERHQDFSQVRNLYIRLTNAKTSQLLVEYKVEKNMMHDTGLIIGKTYRKGDRWFFKAIGQSVRVGTVQELAGRCRD